MSVDIRLVRPGDEALFEHVADGVFDEPVRPDRLTAYLTSPGHCLLVAIADGLIVGQCAAVIHRHPDKVTELYIDEVGVAPAYRRQGIAARMLDAICEVGRIEGCGEAWVGTDVGNIAARALYRRFAHKPEEFVQYEWALQEAPGLA